MKKYCDNCRAFRANSGRFDGRCLRHPPVAINEVPNSIWPTVKAVDWCLDWVGPETATENNESKE